jgi:hypothetical protein
MRKSRPLAKLEALNSVRNGYALSETIPIHSQLMKKMDIGAEEWN